MPELLSKELTDIPSHAARMAVLLSPELLYFQQGKESNKKLHRRLEVKNTQQRQKHDAEQRPYGI